MIAKKNSRFDLERRRTALFQIGLLTVGSLTLAAFTYETPVLRNLEKERLAVNPIDLVLEDLQPEEVKIKPIQVFKQNQDQANNNQLTQDNTPPSDDIVKVGNTQKEPNAGLNGELGIPQGPDLGGFIDVQPDNHIELFPPVPCEYIGGVVAMKGFINNKVSYPEEDRMLGNQGRVYLSFIVEKDGSVTNIKVIRGVSEGIDREAKRLVHLFPKWKPAENAYGKVRTRVQLPINFSLDGN